MPDSPQIPGFTAEQTWALRALIREAIREENEHDERVDKLEDCIFGNGSDGLKTCVHRADQGSNRWSGGTACWSARSNGSG